MKLYLMRHAEPVPGDRQDASRGLTTIGESQAREMGAFLQRQIGTVDIVISSPFARAIQTADLVGENLGCHHIEATRMLEPDGKPEEMLVEIERIAQQSAEVLVVGHHPSINDLINWLCGAQTVEEHFKHGSIAHVDGDNLVWLVTPKMVDRDAGEQDVIESIHHWSGQLAYDFTSQYLSEHLMRPDRAKIIDPMVAKLQRVVAKRFKRQYGQAKNHLDQATPKVYPVNTEFRAVYGNVTRRAYRAGAQHAMGMLPQQGLSYGALESGRLREAKNPPDSLPGPKRTAQTLEDELDSTSIERLAAVLNAARATDNPPISYDELEAQVKALFDQWANGGEGDLSRAEMTAITEVSTAYHQGMADLAKQWAGGNGPITKTWEVQPDACPLCEANAEEGAIDSEAPFTSGDFEPPLHPNCRCSISYQPADVTANA